MNNPRPVPPPQGAVGQTMAPAGGAPGMGMGMAMDEGDGLNLGRIVDTLFEERWLILAVAGVATTIGLFFAIVAKPYYDASLTIQVEDNANPAASVLGELDDAQRRFQQSGTAVKGVIFNGVRPRLSSYYGYGYKYGYRYGYGYKYGYSRNSYGPYGAE